MRNILLATLALALPGAALADPLEDAADARRAYFKLVATESGGLGALLEGDYDAGKARAHAADLVALTAYLQDDLLLPGTSNADLPGKTRALPAIWEDMPGYDEESAAFGAAVAELAAVAGDGKEALAPAMEKLGGTCKSCHDTYRAKEF